jgi:hypothetical protein
VTAKGGGVSVSAKHEGLTNAPSTSAPTSRSFKASHLHNFTITNQNRTTNSTAEQQIPRSTNKSSTSGRLKHGENEKG